MSRCETKRHQSSEEEKLVQAAYDEDLGTMRKLLRRPNVARVAGPRALEAAIKANRIRSVELLLGREDIPVGIGCGLLDHALWFEMPLSVLCTLVRRGQDLLARTQDGRGVVHLAMRGSYRSFTIHREFLRFSTDMGGGPALWYKSQGGRLAAGTCDEPEAQAFLRSEQRRVVRTWNKALSARAIPAKAVGVIVDYLKV